MLELVGMEVGQFSITCRFKNYKDGFLWIFTGVYSPYLEEKQRKFLGGARAIQGLWNDP